VAGIARLHGLIGQHLGEDPEGAEVIIGIETDRGPWVAALVAAGYVVYGVNPLQASRYRERHGVSGAKSDPLTELSDVSAAQVGRPSRWSITEMPGRSGLPGCCSLVASPTITETGHTRRNQSPALSSLPIFDVSRGGP
jgi:hypothetical protein